MADIVFAKKPDARLFDPAFLARYAGEYELGPQTVRVEVQGNGLTVNVPGQPQYHLVPGVSGDFALKEASGFSVRFTESAAGKVTAATFVQPNGVFAAKRK